MKVIIQIVAITLFSSSCFIHKSNEVKPSEESFVYYKKSSDYQVKGDLDSALLFLNIADSLSPNIPFIIHQRGLIKSNLRKFDEALIDLDKSIEISTDEMAKKVRYNNRAIVYLKMNEIEKACQDWRKAGKQGESYIKKYCLEI